MDCIFCKIVNKEIPSKIIYENDTVLAFYDLSPQAPFHILIVPKEHISAPSEINKDNAHLMGDIMLAAAEIAKKENLENGYRIVANSGKDAGQTVFHLHFHMLANRSLSWPPG